MDEPDYQSIPATEVVDNDPMDPPPDASGLELLLYAGRCPSCEEQAALHRSITGEPTVRCGWCEAEFELVETPRPEDGSAPRTRGMPAWVKDGVPGKRKRVVPVGPRG